MPGFRVPGSVDRADAVLVTQSSAGRARRGARALDVDVAGFVRDTQVTLAPRPMIDHGPMARANGIIVHQTGGPSARSALDAYLVPGASGAHFLIDKDGTIYQTASMYRTTHHVGALKPRCRVEMRCTPSEARGLQGKRAGKEIGRIEAAKPWPDRYPGNADSIGIELVGLAAPKPGGGANDFVYEPVTAAQQKSFDWLLPRLLDHLQIDAREVFRHPEVSWKQPSEAASVRW
jgi:N-acetylmuramoyl-L-alanine amidase-like protein